MDNVPDTRLLTGNSFHSPQSIENTFADQVMTTVTRSEQASLA